MALQVIPQQNQPIGLALLGNQLLSGAGDYVARRDQDRRRADMLTDEARNRAERRQDVDVARTYDRENFERLRLLQLEDEQRKRGQGLDDAGKRAALEARLQALGQAASRGLFDIQQIGNMEAENAALGALQQQISKDATFANEQPRNAQARLQELTAAEQAVTQKMSEVERRLSAQPTVDQAAVTNAALQMATQANGGKTPSRDQIQAMIPDAISQAQQDAQVRWYQDRADAQTAYQLLNSQLNTIRQQQQNLTSTFKVAPSAALLSPGASAPPPTSPVGATPGGNPLAGFIDALNQQVPPPSQAAPETRAIQQNIETQRTAPAASVPVLRQGRTQMLAGEYEKLDAPVASTEAKLSNVQKQIQALQSGLSPWQGVTPSPLDASPAATGQFMTELLQQEAALQRQLQQDRTARSTSKTSLLSGLQSVNTPTGFTPVTPPSPGALLSPR